MLPLASIPVVDVDGTLFVQAGIFVGLYFVLKPMLFEPWLAAQAKRALSIDGARADAVRMRASADTLRQECDDAVARAREKAALVRSNARREEDERQSRMLADTRAVSAQELEALRDTLRAQTVQARLSLAPQHEALGRDIATKILGRPL